MGDWLAWVEEHQAFFWWMGVVSVVTLVGSAIAVPVLVTKIPADYFASERRKFDLRQTRHPVVVAAELALKNVIGAILLLAGLAMLVLPGQGVLTILIGLSLLNFPGKYRIERWIVSRGPVLRAANWMRARAGKPPLILELPDGAPTAPR